MRNTGAHLAPVFSFYLFFQQPYKEFQPRAHLFVERENKLRAMFFKERTIGFSTVSLQNRAC